VAISFVVWDEAEPPLEHMLTVNVHRRHFNETQRAVVAAKLLGTSPGSRKGTVGKAEPLESLLARFGPGKSRERAAKALNVSEGSIHNAQVVLRDGVKQLKELVERGQVTVALGAKVTRLSQRQQKEVLDGDLKGLKDRLRQFEPKQAGADKNANADGRNTRKVLRSPQSIDPRDAAHTEDAATGKAKERLPQESSGSPASGTSDAGELVEAPDLDARGRETECDQTRPGEEKCSPQVTAALGAQAVPAAPPGSPVQLDRLRDALESGEASDLELAIAEVLRRVFVEERARSDAIIHTYRGSIEDFAASEVVKALRRFLDARPGMPG
jgi:hypothetical protein